MILELNPFKWGRKFYDHEAQHDLVADMAKTSPSMPHNLNAPQPQETHMSFLSAVGKDFKAVFGWLGSAKGQNTIKVAESTAVAIVSAVNPGAGAALLGLENLFNAALQRTISIEALAAAAGEQDGTGVQKSTAVLDAIAPQSSAFLVSLGVPTPTANQIQAISTIIADGLVAIQNKLPASAAEAATLTVAPTPAA
jgi:hypothetical protein